MMWAFMVSDCFEGFFYALFIKLESYNYPFCNVVYSKHMFLNVILRMI